MELLTLPMPPTINDYYGCNGRVKYIKTKGKEYRKRVITLVKDKGWDFQANVPLKVMIVLNFGTKHTNDLDNRMKGLLDACTHAKVWEDDALIDDLHIVRGVISPGNANVMMNVQAMEDIIED